MPSSKQARKAMLQLSEGTGHGTIYELGCGWGNLLIPLAKKYPTRSIIGYELSVFPWLITLLQIKILRLDNAQVFRKDFLQIDLSHASLIVCYLFTQRMQEIETRLAKVQGAKYLISNNFSLPKHTPIKTVEINDLYKSPVYLYEL